MRTQKSIIEYGIIGLGRFGFNLATALAEAGKEVMVIDKDENKIRQIKHLVDEAFIVSSIDKETLEGLSKNFKECVLISAKDKIGIDELKEKIISHLQENEEAPG